MPPIGRFAPVADAGNRAAAEIERVAVMGAHHLHLVRRLRLFRTDAAAQCRHVNVFILAKNRRQAFNGRRLQQGFVPLHVHVHVGVERCGHLPHPVGTGLAARRGHVRLTPKCPHNVGNALVVRGDHYGIQVRCPPHDLPDPLNERLAADVHQGLARQAC